MKLGTIQLLRYIVPDGNIVKYIVDANRQHEFWTSRNLLDVRQLRQGVLLYCNS